MREPLTLFLEDVQQHERWLTALVRRLAEPCDVDDVLQDTWLKAIEQPPKQRRAWRRWLETVARNFATARWHDRRRRRNSEARAARREAVPSTEETVERLATVEMLVGVIRELPEPYRTAVLLRHYHGLEVQEVATQLGVTEAAVRQRVKRGLDDVRRRLKEREVDRGGEGAGWKHRILSVLPYSTAALGVLIMNMKVVSLLATAGVLAGGYVLVAALQSPPEATAGGTALDSAGSQEQIRAAGPTELERVGVDIPRQDGGASPSEVASLTFRGRVVDTRGVGVTGVRMIDSRGNRVGESDASGGFACEGVSETDLPKPDERYFTVRRRLRERSGALAADPLYVVAPSVGASGQVVDATGTALDGVSVTVEVAPLLEFPAPLEGTDGMAVPAGTTGSDGRFSFAALPGGVCRLRFKKQGYEPGGREVAERPGDDMQIVLDEVDGGRWLLSGRVLDDSSRLVPNAVVGLGRVRGRSDSYGRYDLQLSAAQVAESGTALFAARPGLQTLVTEAPVRSEFASDRTLERDLQFAGPALSIAGTVRGPDGRPAANAVVALWRVRRMGGAGFAENLAIEEGVKPHRLGIAPRRVYSVTGADGRFTLRGLRDRDYQLRVLHDEYLTLTSDPIRAGATGVELGYPSDQFRSVVCRVVNTSGQTMPGLRIDMSTQSHDSLSGSSSWDMNDDQKTDANGRTTFRRVLRREDVQVRVRGPNIITGFLVIRPSDGAEFEIVVERRCHFRIESSDPKWASAEVELRDDTGKVVWISWARGTYNQTLKLVKGRSVVVTASERATTLLVGDGKKVPLKLIPGEVVVVRF